MKESTRTERRTLRRAGAVLLTLILVLSVTASAALAAGSAEAAPGLVYAAAEERVPLNASEVYAQNVNSTVGITTTATMTNAFGYDTTFAAAGSGFIISHDGYILTNYHVVEDSQSITVAMYDGTTYDAELIGYDQSNDIAVLKIEAQEDLTPVTVGNSDELLVGQDVLAIGNPLGELTFSLTTGVVSALDRDVTLSGSVRMRLIQTDCAINSGNSGGALFNMYGEVIGITNAKYSGSGSTGEASVDNIGFAIPINTVAGIVEQIMTTGEISTPFIGITITDVSDDLAAYGIPKGADVYEVAEDSPAAEAGIQPKDIITEADGHPITGSDDLVKYIKSLSAGDEVLLSVYRQGETLQFTVTVGENVKSALPEPEPEEEAQAAQPEQQMPQEFFFPFEDFFGQQFHN